MQNREWRFFITDMIGFCEKVVSHADGLTKDEFLEEEIIYEATMWNLRLIGEAATHVPSDVREAYPHIQWGRIIGMRNRLTHGYLDVNDNVIWSTIETEVPELLNDLRKLSKQIDEDDT